MVDHTLCTRTRARTYLGVEVVETVAVELLRLDDELQLGDARVDAAQVVVRVDDLAVHLRQQRLVSAHRLHNNSNNTMRTCISTLTGVPVCVYLKKNMHTHVHV